MRGFLLIHFPISLTDRLRQRRYAVRAADADVQPQLRRVCQHDLLHRLAKLREPLPEGVLADLREDEQELITAVADERIRLAGAFEDDAGDGAQRLIADEVSVGVVDVLEVIYIREYACVRESR